FNFDLSNALVDYGLLGQAQTPLLQARANGADPDALNDSRRRLAERYYQRSDWSGAWNALGDSPPRSKAAGLIEWQDLQSRILIAQGRLGEASALLRQIGGSNDFESWARYYNLGVALVADGEVGQGLTVLDRIGSVTSAEPQMRALSDRANLALGTYFLKAGQGATAIAILGRVDAQGPCSSRAMLNLGWAWLAPPGAVQKEVMLGDERTLGPPPEVYSASDVRHDQNLYQRYLVDAFSSAPVERSGDSRVHRALALWSELAGQQSEDGTKQEAQLAIAVELQRSGARGAAAKSYTRAIDALEQGIVSIGKARQYVEGEGLNADLLEPPAQSAFDRTLRKLPPPPVADYLSDTLASRQFQDGLATLRDIRFLGGSLDGIGRRIDSLDQRYCQATAYEAAAASCRNLQELRVRITALRPRLEVAAQTGDERLRRQLLEQLQVQENWQSALLADARFELARLYDAAPAAK
ncbi:MAG TPA: hypothetical protein VNX47_12590, partial [Nevskia sp.]|nr:hypothetical protein [Nevskia sp.]